MSLAFRTGKEDVTVTVTISELGKDAAPAAAGYAGTEGDGAVHTWSYELGPEEDRTQEERVT